MSEAKRTETNDTTIDVETFSDYKRVDFSDDVHSRKNMIFPRGSQPEHTRTVCVRMCENRRRTQCVEKVSECFLKMKKVVISEKRKIAYVFVMFSIIITGKQPTKMNINVR